MTISHAPERNSRDFHPSFWVANGMELFERLAYYGQQIVFMIYLRNNLGFTEVAGRDALRHFRRPDLPAADPRRDAGGQMGFPPGVQRSRSRYSRIGYFLIGIDGNDRLSSGMYGGLAPYWLLVVFLRPDGLRRLVYQTLRARNRRCHDDGEDEIARVCDLLLARQRGGDDRADYRLFCARSGSGTSMSIWCRRASCLAMLVVNLFLYKEVRRPAAPRWSRSMGKKIANLFRRPRRISGS